MSDFNDDRPGLRRRLLSKAEQDQQEIQDWLNGPGGMVIAAVIVFIVLFSIVSAVLR